MSRAFRGVACGRGAGRGGDDRWGRGAVRRRAASRLLLLLVALLAACGEAPAVTGNEPASGLRITGTVGGRQLAVNDAVPEVVADDCDPNDGPDEDLCVISRDLNGEQVVLVFENPAVLTPGSRVEVAAPRCPTPAACDEITDVALIQLQLDRPPRRRALGGQVDVDTVEQGHRYTGSFALDFADGRVTGSFDVAPRP